MTSELAVPLCTSEGMIGLINIETARALPPGATRPSRRSRSAITGPVEEMRTKRTVDLSSLARLFVYMSALREPGAIAQVAARTLGRVLPIESSRLVRARRRPTARGIGGVDCAGRRLIRCPRQRLCSSAITSARRPCSSCSTRVSSACRARSGADSLGDPDPAPRERGRDRAARRREPVLDDVRSEAGRDGGVARRPCGSVARCRARARSRAPERSYGHADGPAQPQRPRGHGSSGSSRRAGATGGR